VQKGTFTRFLAEGEYLQVKGLTSTYFGICKDSQQHGPFILVHIPTGMSIIHMRYSRDVRSFITLLENNSFPVSWEECDKEVLAPNEELFQKIRRLHV